MSKLNLVVKASGALLLWAMAAVALPAQTFTSLFSFDGANGYSPSVWLTQGTDGIFYGTTEYGGANDLSRGAAFNITPSGTLRTLYTLCSQTGVALTVSSQARGWCRARMGTIMGRPSLAAPSATVPSWARAAARFSK
jgi:hypothetical protein